MDNLYPDNELDDIDQGPSKSALKRRMAELQQLAEVLCKLGDTELLGFELPESLIDSLQTARRLKSSNARNRQLRHASKLLDKCGEETIAEIARYFDAKKKTDQSLNRRHKLIEDWRDKLISSPDRAIAELIEGFPNINRQELRTLVRLAAKEKSLEKPPSQQRKLFAYLRDRVITG